ncbi:heparan-alpha-glucosaminide N-acetyltransferase [Mesorhizobium xinjiangense]|uniref:heparan-alpha-glucosaminide N-acetyltransferase n=1 Tax=Mesorhizobium xinjiangense TaxID=2678685 RepID=UPI0012EE25BE|nr:heparan-alpha-glucosaminide N-acetyltransferase [Mesorhizobium xinjiangense]
MYSQAASEQAPLRTRRRIGAIDAARGMALLTMAIYHLAWDLEFFGYAPHGMTAEGGWRLFARAIASSFLFLVGFSLFLAHGKGIRWQSFWRRLAMVAGAAALITVATRLATPGSFIFFGILHQIALASLLGLAFLKVPARWIVLIAVAVIVAPHVLRNPLFDHPAFWWLGLSADPPRSNDYVPVFPWFGAVLLGMAAARLAVARDWLERVAAWSLPSWSGILQFAGRHSLAVYLIHQPVLIACVWFAAQLIPPAGISPQAQLRQSCEQQCMNDLSRAFCERYCGCVLDRTEGEGKLDQVYGGVPDPQLDGWLQETAAACTAETMRASNEGGNQ